MKNLKLTQNFNSIILFNPKFALLFGFQKQNIIKPLISSNQIDTSYYFSIWFLFLKFEFHYHK